MYWKKVTKGVVTDAEFLAHEKGLLTVSRTIMPDGIEADDAGEKWVPKGSYIDKDGKMTVPTVTADSVTFDNPPIGILFSPVKVTNGPDAGAVMIEGWVKGDYMDWGDQEWNKSLGEAVHKLLPGINFKANDGTIIYGAASSATEEGVTPEPEPTAQITGDKDAGFTVTYENLGNKVADIRIFKSDGGKEEVGKVGNWEVTDSNPYKVTIKETMEQGNYTLKAGIQSGKPDLATQDFTVEGE